MVFPATTATSYGVLLLLSWLTMSVILLLLMQVCLIALVINFINATQESSAAGSTFFTECTNNITASLSCFLFDQFKTPIAAPTLLHTSTYHFFHFCLHGKPCYFYQICLCLCYQCN